MKEAALVEEPELATGCARARGCRLLVCSSLVGGRQRTPGVGDEAEHGGADKADPWRPVLALVEAHDEDASVLLALVGATAVQHARVEDECLAHAQRCETCGVCAKSCSMLRMPLSLALSSLCENVVGETWRETFLV